MQSADPPWPLGDPIAAIAARVLLSILESGSDMRGDQEIQVVLKGLPMPTLTIEYHDEDQRLALEQAVAYLADLRQLALDAPAGAVLEAREGLALDQGRALLRSTLAAALHSRVARAEQKGGTRGPAPRRTPGAPRGRTAGSS
jgi:hypothetical protein